MRTFIVTIAIGCSTLFSMAQVPQTATKPSKVCVGQIRNQTPTSFEVEKLRQSFLEALQSTKLVKDGSIALVAISPDNSDDAKADVQKQGCDFAIYTRVLRKPKEDTRTYETGTSFEVSRHDNIPAETYGLQCTLERTSSGMPILIDRRFDLAPTKGDKAVLKLLADEAVRVQDALAKKLTP